MQLNYYCFITSSLIDEGRLVNTQKICADQNFKCYPLRRDKILGIFSKPEDEINVGVLMVVTTKLSPKSFPDFALVGV